MKQNKRKHLKTLFETLGEKYQFNGTILAAEDGEILYHHSFGYAELTEKLPLQTNSLFELASLSKPFTALGIILLEEKGILGYEDKVERWLPGFPYQGITIRHLLHHTSGLPDYMGWFVSNWDQHKIAQNQDIVDMLMNEGLPNYFEPNEGWLYSNTGYVLLAVIIEKASGMSYADFMNTNIFSPVGMSETRMYNRRLRPERIDHYAYGYVYDVHSETYVLPDDLEETNYVVYLDGIQGDGTVNSVTSDLFRFDQALYQDDLISNASKKAAYSPVRLNNGGTIDYGFGWVLQNSPEKGRIVSHDGGWPGYSTAMIRYIDHRKTLIYLSNKEEEAEYEQAILKAAEHILFGQPYEIPERPADKKKKAIEPAIYASYVGSYSFQDGTAARVTAENERLYLEITGQLRLELFPSSETRFFLRSLSVELEFMLGDDVAKSFILYENGTEEEAVRTN
ncbi:serine hydrolase [Bacillus spizizenii]|uniref:Serine hydrolase n=2 Tax=Bacillus spizizenii TaxID=96241 RepID=A0A9Q4DMZ9_BACSC|nr:penicillin-binding protein [Bacillus sp. BSC154]MCY7870655.1 serine hydrolase [Bacillus spizizenii]MCY7874140.1 serine hydrolase [Bacillus spizizenii]MCY7961014.1 serine hydrolase [Bacillus spizizenii]MCY7987634.1 serine hydrolase [Bacillus spizizenii]